MYKPKTNDMTIDSIGDITGSQYCVELYRVAKIIFQLNESVLEKNLYSVLYLTLFLPLLWCVYRYTAIYVKVKMYMYDYTFDNSPHACVQLCKPLCPRLSPFHLSRPIYIGYYHYFHLHRVNYTLN